MNQSNEKKNLDKLPPNNTEASQPLPDLTKEQIAKLSAKGKSEYFAKLFVENLNKNTTS